jgi:hypothetical protein
MPGWQLRHPQQDEKEEAHPQSLDYNDSFLLETFYNSVPRLFC